MIHTVVTPKHERKTSSSSAPSDGASDSDGGVILEEQWTRSQNLIGTYSRNTWLNPRLPGLRDRLALSPRRDLDWCDRGKSHVDFKDDETVPLLQGRFLGHGSQGGVYETTCKGITLAWKKRHCPRGIGTKERGEIEILKRLSHQHIIKLIGTYTHRPFLGLLLWPVAVCDLATFLEDIDALILAYMPREPPTVEDRVMRRLHALCTSKDDWPDLFPAAVRRLSRSFGCLTSAITYIHGQRIRHKDLKPSNVLLSHDGLWVTDFGISTDLAALATTGSECVERGTAKYFAPEVAIYERSGRSADIFSLGCMFLEMVALCRGSSLQDLRRLRPAENFSFQANLHLRREWFTLLKSRQIRIQHLLCEIEQMIDPDPEMRPMASELMEHLGLIEQFQTGSDTPLYGYCCTPQNLTPRAKREIDRLVARIEDLKIQIVERDEEINHLRNSTPLVPPPPIGGDFTPSFSMNRLEPSTYIAPTDSHALRLAFSR
ncbi:kinase-like protein [Glonium stellatum]|uniref:Kinase-like protein n=1 Tax=Glonium stellatum TaxID=574774 RepID=A0A8E2JW97_9PEZI|nr:kinase-like protein [Glonium stellatum]